MSTYLLDTNHVGAIYRRQLNLLTHPNVAASDTFGVCVPSIGELWFMVFNSDRAHENARNMQSVLDQFRIWPFDERAAVEFGQIKAELRKSGRPIPDVDVQIASIARLNQFTLLSDDAHFTSVSGIAVDNWIR